MRSPRSGRAASGGQGISPLSVTTGQLTAGALIMLPVSMIVDQPWTHAFPPLSAWARDRRAGLALHRLRLRALFPADRIVGRDQCLAGDLAGAAGRDPARRPVPRRELAPQDFVGLGLIALGLAAIDGRRAQPFRAARRLPTSSLAASGARPVEVADVAPDFLALGVEQDRGRQHRSGPSAPEKLIFGS